MKNEKDNNIQNTENQNWFNTPLKGKKKVIALIIAFLFGAGALLSPLISPYLIDWIDFTGKGWDIAEIVFGAVCCITIIGSIIWFAIDSVRSLCKTIKTVFGKKN